MGWGFTILLGEIRAFLLHPLFYSSYCSVILIYDRFKYLEQGLAGPQHALLYRQSHFYYDFLAFFVAYYFAQVALYNSSEIGWGRFYYCIGNLIFV